jgi:hypothetical protein
MAKAVQTFTGYTMDYTSQIQYAVSETGKVFRRSQYRDPRYGYKWRSWSETAPVSVEGLSPNGPKNWRLPA